MKKFEYTFWSIWGAGGFELFTVVFYKNRMASYIDVTICNLRFRLTFRSDKQIKEQKKWNKLMDKKREEWLLEDFMSQTLTKKTPKLKKAKKVSHKKVAAKRKTTK